MNATLTPTEIARALGVSPRTVGQWCDADLFPHFRMPDINGKRGALRVYADTFRVWCEDRRMRYPEELVALAKKRGSSRE